MEVSEIRKTLARELVALKGMLNDDAEKLKDVIRQFADETPRLLQELRQQIVQGHWREAEGMAHKLKTRYAYLGMDQIVVELAAWEDLFKQGNTLANVNQALDRLDKTTNEVIQELRLSHHYHNDSTAAELPLQGKCVLVAEDDIVNAMIFEAFIKETGARIIKAHDGFEAMSKAAEYHPDLIFMDVHMPFCNGLEAIKGIRSRGIRVPIVSLSASSSLNEQSISLQAGADDFLTKPVGRQSVEQMLLKYLAPVKHPGL